MPDIAQKVTINLAESKVYVDGVEFPWAIAQRGPNIDQLPIVGEDIGLVSIPILAAHVEVIPDA